MHEGNVRIELGIGGAADRSLAFVYRKEKTMTYKENTVTTSTKCGDYTVKAREVDIAIAEYLPNSVFGLREILESVVFVGLPHALWDDVDTVTGLLVLLAWHKDPSARA